MSQNFLLPDEIEASAWAVSEQKIPRILYQTFKTRRVPAGMVRAAMSWVKSNTDYTYRFSSDEDCRALLREHFDDAVLAAFEQLQVGAFKADLWRYCVLYVHGGVYADLDTVSLAPLAQVIGKDDEFVSVSATVAGGVFNAFIGATPGHAFLKQAIEDAVTSIVKGGADHPLAMTGPLCLGRAMNKVLGRPADTVFDAGEHHDKGFSYRVLPKSNVSDPRKRTVSYNGRAVFLCKYPGYDADLKAGGQSHWRQGVGLDLSSNS